MAERTARWITIRQPFDYRWPGRSAITAYSRPGEFLVKGEVADFAVSRGFATEGKADGSEARSSKGRRTRRRKDAKATPDVAASDHGSNTGVDGAGLADHDRPDVQLPVDPHAKQR